MNWAIPGGRDTTPVYRLAQGPMHDSWQCRVWGLNPWPMGPKPSTLTTRPPRPPITMTNSVKRLQKNEDQESIDRLNTINLFTVKLYDPENLPTMSLTCLTHNPSWSFLFFINSFASICGGILQPLKCKWKLSFSVYTLTKCQFHRRHITTGNQHVVLHQKQYKTHTSHHTTVCIYIQAFTHCQLAAIDPGRMNGLVGQLLSWPGLQPLTSQSPLAADQVLSGVPLPTQSVTRERFRSAKYKMTLNGVKSVLV